MTGSANTTTRHPPLVGTFLVLMVLLAATVILATVELGALAIPVMLAIAVAKAALIALYFMHARYDGWMTWVVVGAALFWLTVLISITLIDYWSRAWMPIPEGWMP